MKWDNFTAGRVDGFRCLVGKKQSIFWDGKTPGLGLRVTSTGARSYIFETSLRGKTIRITIGAAGTGGTWSVGDAQDKATAYKMQTDSGIDPREAEAEQAAAFAAKQAIDAKKKQVERDKQELLAREAWDRYVAAPHPKWGKQHRADHIIAASRGGVIAKIGKKETKAAPLAYLLELPLHAITAEVVQAWLSRECLTRATFAHNSFRKFRTFIKWCTKQTAFQHVVNTDCCLTEEVRDIIPTAKTKEGDCLQREQLQMWFRAVGEIQNPVISTYLQALLLTGARRGELAHMRWTDVDFRWRSVTIRDKIEGTRVIPIGSYLVLLLNDLPRRNEWVFSSTAARDGRLSEPRIAHTKALSKIGLPHVSLHGLRRSYSTLSEWVEIPSGVTAQIMGHKPSAIAEKHYVRRPLDLLRMWHDQIEAWILEQAGISFQKDHKSASRDVFSNCNSANSTRLTFSQARAAAAKTVSGTSLPNNYSVPQHAVSYTMRTSGNR